MHEFDALLLNIPHFAVRLETLAKHLALRIERRQSSGSQGPGSIGWAFRRESGLGSVIEPLTRVVVKMLVERRFAKTGTRIIS